MYITITKNSHTKRERVYLVEGYRDKDGKVKHRTLRSKRSDTGNEAKVGRLDH